MNLILKLLLTLFISGCSKPQEINLVTKESEKLIFNAKTLEETIGGEKEIINLMHLDILMKVLDLLDSEENINFGITVCEILTASKGHPNAYFDNTQIEASQRLEKLLKKDHFDKAIKFLEGAKEKSKNKSDHNWLSAIKELEKRLNITRESKEL